MAILEKFEKQPGETHWYDISYVEFLASIGDTAAIYPPVVTFPAGMTQPIAAAFVTPGVLRVWCAGGLDDISYKGTLVVKTDLLWIQEDEIVIKVKES